MAYCTNADVVNEFKKIDFATNPVMTTAKIDEFILQADAEINSYVSLRYVSPVTAGEALLVLKQISIDLVAHRVQTILSVKTADGQGDQDSRIKTRQDIARARLKLIGEGKMNLIGATPIVNSDGTSGNVSYSESCRTFDIEKKQW